jgi:polyhydroxyalkanoate synthase
MDPVKLITRKIQVFQNGWDRDWLSGYEAIRDWVEEFIPYPGAAFKQFVLDYIRDDKLRSGTLTMRGTPIDIKRIRVNLLVVVGMKDDVARPPSVEAGYEEIPSPDKKLLRVPLGHIGLVAGEKAPSMVWEPVARWLQERSEPIIKKERSS